MKTSLHIYEELTMSDLMLDVGQANELKLAARAAGATNADLKTLSSGDIFATILPVLRGMAEVKMKDLLSRKVTDIDRSLSLRQALEATGRKLYVNDDVVKTMPRDNGDEVFFFNLGRWISDDDLETEYAARGLVPCDPFTLAKVNQDDPAFADEYPNCTHWGKNDNGTWAYATFDRFSGERGVGVGHDDDDWYDRWWFAGVRK